MSAETKCQSKLKTCLLKISEGHGFRYIFSFSKMNENFTMPLPLLWLLKVLDSGFLWISSSAVAQIQGKQGWL